MRTKQRARATMAAGAVTCLMVLAAPRASGQGIDLAIENPLGFEPLLLHSSRGHALAVAGLVAALLLSDAGDRADTTSGMTRSGSWFFLNEAAYDRGYGEHPTKMLTGRIGFAHFLRDWLAVGIEVHGSRMRDERLEGGGARALGGMWFARWHPVRRSTWTTFFEYGAGLLFSDRRFPPNGPKRT